MTDHTIEKMWSRIHNLTRRVTLKVADDTGAIQTHQTEGYPDELRTAVPRVQEFGISTVPLPGAEGLTVATNAGYQGTSAITNTNDPRYRVKNQKPGEFAGYVVEGADDKGNNGTVRTFLKCTKDWVCSLIARTINVGDTNVVTINIGTTASSVTINMGGSSATVNITGSNGDVTIAGISLRHHVHGGVTTGSGNTGQPHA